MQISAVIFFLSNDLPLWLSQQERFQRQQLTISFLWVKAESDLHSYSNLAKTSQSQSINQITLLVEPQHLAIEVLTNVGKKTPQNLFELITQQVDNSC